MLEMRPINFGRNIKAADLGVPILLALAAVKQPFVKMACHEKVTLEKVTLGCLSVSLGLGDL